MTAQPATLTGLVADANVLIDYAGAGLPVIGVIARHLAPIYIPSPILEEVTQVSQEQVEQLRCEVIEPTLAQASEAAAGAGTVSFQDRLCLIVARDAGWQVLTNDRSLRNACGEAAVRCVWGLEAMALAVEAGHLSAKRAVAAVEKISAANRFITPEIVRRFRRRIGS